MQHHFFQVHVVSGGVIDIRATVELGKTIEAGSVLALKLTKTGVIDIPIPCMDVSRN